MLRWNLMPSHYRRRTLTRCLTGEASGYPVGQILHDVFRVRGPSFWTLWKAVKIKSFAADDMLLCDSALLQQAVHHLEAFLRGVMHMAGPALGAALAASS